jgi:hypothetical protein
MTTLSSLRTQVQQRADMVNSSFISTSELNTFLNGSLAELYDLLVSRFEDYYTISFQFSIASGSDGYDMSLIGPAPIYKLRGVEKAISGPTDWATLQPFQFPERNKYNNRINTLRRGGRSVLQYRMVGNKLIVIPADTAPGTYQMWYVPAWTDLVNDNDTASNLQNWHEYAVVDAAIKCLAKEESDCSILVMQKEQLKQRIEAMASNRDAGMNDRVADVSRKDQ